jgi:hypothetical protein
MHLIVFLVGIVLAFAGVMLILSAVPVVDVAAAALFTSGTVAIAGGLILMALAPGLRSLSKIAERFDIQPLPLPPVAALEREDPAPRATRSAPEQVAVPAKRPSLLGWFGRATAASSAEQKPQAPAPEQTPPTVDLAPLTRIPEEPRPPAPSPSAPQPPASAPAAAAPAPIPRTPLPPLRPAAKPAANPVANGTQEATVYKSGVIDGMAYTLFMDGSIEAELPQGKVKFASVDELQTYLTTR